MYTELAPDELLDGGFAAATARREPFLVRWDLAGAARSAAELLPREVDLATSGSTGEARTWRRTREQMWDEAGLLAALLAPRRPEAVLSFAPPRHVFGALGTILVPARLGVPAWYRPDLFGPMPPAEPRRHWAVIAIPWAFTLLRRRPEWLRAARGVTVLHSTATVPAEAAELPTGSGAEHTRIIEVFGSTETGGVATRTWSGRAGPWTLLDDVEFDGPAADTEAPLRVRSPRLAFPPGGRPESVLQMDDFVERDGDRRFRFAGRRHRLVKVNGRRFDLDALERSVRRLVPCLDAACVPVADARIGEHFDVLVVPDPAVGASSAEIHRSLSDLDVRPRRVRLVPHIDRTATGKLRRVSAPAAPAESGADT